MRVRERDGDVGSERVVGVRVRRLQHLSGFFFGLWLCRFGPS